MANVRRPLTWEDLGFFQDRATGRWVESAVRAGGHHFDPHQLRDPGGENGGQWVSGPHIDNPLDLDVEMHDPARLQPWNEVDDEAKLDSLAESMRESGWRGPPIVVIAGQDHGWGAGDPVAITGSHRIHAAREAGIDVPTVQLDDLLARHGTSLAEIDAETYADPDDERHTESVTRLDYYLPADVVEQYGLDAH